MGCPIAYDTVVSEALSDLGDKLPNIVIQKTFSRTKTTSIQSLCNIYNEYYDSFEQALKDVNKKEKGKRPAESNQFKLLDLTLWHYGKHVVEEKTLKKRRDKLQNPQN